MLLKNVHQKDRGGDAGEGRRRGAGAVSDCWPTPVRGARIIVLPVLRSLRPS